MEDYRKLAMEAAMKIPYQTHSELLTSADKIYAWLVKDKITVNTQAYPKYTTMKNKKSPSDADEDLSLPEMRAIMQR